MGNEVVIKGHYEATLADIFEELPEVLQTITRDKEDLKNSIKTQMLDNIKGPQYNAVRLCMFPIYEDEVDDNIVQQASIEDGEDERKLIAKCNKSKDTWCEHHQICTMYQNKIHEAIGQKCFFEVQKVEQLTNELVEDLSINILQDHNDRRMIGELITYSLIEDRAIASLACTSLQMTNVTYGKNGMTVERVQNIHLKTIESMNSMKTKVREKLVATKSDRIKMNLEKAKVVNKDAHEALKNKIKSVENKLKPKGGIGLINQQKSTEKEIAKIANIEKTVQSITKSITDTVPPLRDGDKIQTTGKVEMINFNNLF